MGWKFYFLGLAAMSMVSGIVQLLESTVPALFVFGDSLLDTGNNNNVSTLVKATSPPYGDYPPGGSGGRFSNGPVTTDFVGEFLSFVLLGSKLINTEAILLNISGHFNALVF